MNYLFQTSVIMDDSAIHRLLGNIQKTSYDDGIHQTLRSMKSQASQAA